MKPIVALLLFFHIGFLRVMAQQEHYIYLQSAQYVPFYVRYEGRIISASTGGYVILSRLKAGEVNFYLGFPNKKEPELHFVCTIDRRDLGFEISHTPEKGWVLQEITSGTVVTPIPEQTKSNVAEELKPSVVEVIQPATDDAFATLLAKVTQDSTIKQVAVVKEVERKPEKEANNTQRKTTFPDSVAAVPAIKEPTVASSKNEVQPEQVTESWVAPAKSQPEIISVLSSAVGVDIRIRDIGANHADTITLFIARPNQAAEAQEGWQQTASSETKADTLAGIIGNDSSRMEVTDTVVTLTSTHTFNTGDTATITSPMPTPEKVKVVQPVADTLNTPVKVDTVSSVARPAATDVLNREPKSDTAMVITSNTHSTAGQEQQQSGKPYKTEPSAFIPNTNCKAIADEEDFLRLRRKMVNARSEELMVEEAKKAFRQKCYSVEQLQKLSFILLTDEWRYRFYDAALPFVSNYSGFAELENNLKDEYYKRRFRALLPQ